LIRRFEKLCIQQNRAFLGKDKTGILGMAWNAGHGCEKLGKPFSLRDRETRQMLEYDARACFSKSERIFAEAEIEMENARTLREWARYEFEMGNRDQATEMWQKARDIFAKLGAEMEVQRMKEPL
jgi:tetratricopeptide (TPR) repeat protein